MGVGNNGLIEIGEITRAHGIRGEVKVISYSNQPERFQSLRSLYLSSETHPGVWKRILKCQVGAKQTILLLEGLHSRDDAEQVRGSVLSIRKSELPVLPEGSYYIQDLIGFDVLTSDKGRIGTLQDVLDFPAQDVYVIQTENGEIMIPGVKEFIEKVDPSERKITIKPIDGLLDLNAD